LTRKAALFLLLLVVATAGCRRKESAAGSAAAGNHVAARVAKLYFESPAMLLVAEPRNLQLSDSSGAALPVVVRELLKGPVTPALSRTFPADVVLRGTYLLPDGTALVDLGGPTLSAGWATGSHQELMAVYSMVQTIGANFADAKRVRFLINGTPAETLAGHIALDRFLHPDPAFVDPRG
jgi:hypothetical protein